MQQARLGGTGLLVSRAGLGCGGHSRLGQARGATEDESIRVVRTAMDLGVTFLDTAPVYRTEEIVGRAVRGVRDTVCLSTKVSPRAETGLVDRERFRDRIEQSLSRLGTGWLDVLFLHGVEPPDYAYCAGELLPVMAAARDAGLVRAIGISERYERDPSHQMLRLAQEDPWDVVMVAVNFLNPSARRHVLPWTSRRDIGVVAMCSVRGTIGRPAELRDLLRGLAARGHIDQSAPDAAGLWECLSRPDAARAVVDAAYRFTSHEPGVDVTLTGTGSVGHLTANIGSIGAGRLPSSSLRRLDELFGDLEDVTLWDR